MKNNPKVPCWVVRDNDGTLWLFYNYSPTLRHHDGVGDIYDNETKERVQLPKELFPTLRFEDGPQTVKLVIE